MATCPKCGTKLRITQWKPECPRCGVNMVYYKANDRLLTETEQAEIQHALFQPKIDRAKAAFFGSPQAILRVVLTIIPIGALFLPLVHLVYPEKKTSASIIQMFTLIKNIGFVPLLKNAFHGDFLSLSVLLLLFSVLLLLVSLICIVMSLGKYGKQRTIILNILLLGSALSSAVIFFAKRQAAMEAFSGATQAKLFYGSFIYLVLLLLLFIYNVFLMIKGLPVKHTVCYIGGLPSEEYFAMVNAGESELVIKNRMIEALTKMQEDVRKKAEEEEKRAAEERAARK